MDSEPAAGQAGARQDTIDEQRWSAVGIDHGNMGPIAEGDIVHQQRRDVIHAVLGDADAIGSDGDTGPGIGVRVKPGHDRIPLSAQAADTDGRFCRNISCRRWPRPEFHREVVRDT